MRLYHANYSDYKQTGICLVSTDDGGRKYFFEKIAIFDSKKEDIILDIKSSDFMTNRYGDNLEDINNLVAEYPVKVKKSISLDRDYCFLYKKPNEQVNEWYIRRYDYALYIPLDLAGLKTNNFISFGHWECSAVNQYYIFGDKLASCYHKTEEYGEALRELYNSLEIKNTSAIARLALGDNNELDKALMDYKQEYDRLAEIAQHYTESFEYISDIIKVLPKRVCGKVDKDVFGKIVTVDEYESCYDVGGYRERDIIDNCERYTKKGNLYTFYSRGRSCAFLSDRFAWVG